LGQGRKTEGAGQKTDGGRGDGKGGEFGFHRLVLRIGLFFLLLPRHCKLWFSGRDATTTPTITHYFTRA
jgi:hypothetical protein